MYDQLFSQIDQYVSLTEEEKQVIIDMAIFKFYKKGDVLLEQGQVGAEQYMVIQGCIRCYYVIDGEEKTTAFYMEQDALEPAGVDSGQPCPYSIACVEDSIVGIARAADQQAVFERFPKFESICRMITEEQLNKTREEFDLFKFSSPTERYIKLLETKPQLVQRVPQHQLASYLGVTPESLSRIRKRVASVRKQA